MERLRLEDKIVAGFMRLVNLVLIFVFLLTSLGLSAVTQDQNAIRYGTRIGVRASGMHKPS